MDCPPKRFYRPVKWRLSSTAAFVSGWPLEEDDNGDVLWEPNTDVSHFTKFYGVTHWIEFPSLP